MQRLINSPFLPPGMSLATKVAQRFSLTILNALTASFALGGAYLVHMYGIKYLFCLLILLAKRSAALTYHEIGIQI